MNKQDKLASQTSTPSSECPRGKFVIPQPKRNLKEFPKEKFYSFLYSEKCLQKMDLKAEDRKREELFQKSVLVHDLPNIQEEEIIHAASPEDENTDPHQTIFPDISKYVDDTESDDDSSCLSDVPLNYISHKITTPERLLLRKGSGYSSAYERCDSDDNTSDWEVGSCDEDSISLPEDET